MSALRDNLAAVFRAMPRIPGLLRWGPRVGRLLTDWTSESDCQVTFRLRDGSFVRTNLRAEAISFWTGEYDRRLIERLGGCLRPGSVVLDVGACCGMWSVQLGRRLGALGGLLYALEPVERNVLRLREVIALNGLEAVVRAYGLALGDREGEVTMRTEVSPVGNAFVLAPGDASPAEADVSARVTTLDRFASDEGVHSSDLVKLDVEGAELQILQGGRAFLRQHHPIVFGEFNAVHMKRFGHSLADAYDLCVPWGYRFHRCVGGKTFVPIDRPEDGAEDVLMVPEDVEPGILNSLRIAS